MNTDMNTTPCEWESGALGRSEEHVVVASADEARELDDAMGMQLVSIRLQKKLVKDLKEIAEHRGLNYQPMVRDLLHRFAEFEMRAILEEKLQEMRRLMEASRHETGPIADFMEQERRRA